MFRASSANRTLLVGGLSALQAAIQSQLALEEQGHRALRRISGAKKPSVRLPSALGAQARSERAIKGRLRVLASDDTISIRQALLRLSYYRRACPQLARKVVGKKRIRVTAGGLRRIIRGPSLPIANSADTTT